MDETQEHTEWKKIQEYLLDDFTYVEQKSIRWQKQTPGVGR